MLPSHSALHFLRIGSAKTDGAILNLPPSLGLGATAEAPVELLLLLSLLPTPLTPPDKLELATIFPQDRDDEDT
mgnify:CR=1 FL=1